MSGSIDHVLLRRIRLSADEAVEAIGLAYEGAHYFEPFLAIAKAHLGRARQLVGSAPNVPSVRSDLIESLRAVANALEEENDPMDDDVHVILLGRRES